MKTQMTAVIALSLLLGAGIANAEATAGAGNRTQLKQDRQDRNQAIAKMKEDRQKLMNDKKAGATPEQIKADREALKKDRQARHEKQEKVNADKKNLGLETKKGQ